MFRTQITRQARLFSTQSRLQKSMMDTAKETLQNANKVVGETLAKGIDNTRKCSFPSCITRSVRASFRRLETASSHHVHTQTHSIYNSLTHHRERSGRKQRRGAGQDGGDGRTSKGHRQGDGRRGLGQDLRTAGQGQGYG